MSHALIKTIFNEDVSAPATTAITIPRENRGGGCSLRADSHLFAVSEKWSWKTGPHHGRRRSNLKFPATRFRQSPTHKTNNFTRNIPQTTNKIENELKIRPVTVFNWDVFVLFFYFIFFLFRVFFVINELFMFSIYISPIWNMRRACLEWKFVYGGNASNQMFLCKVPTPFYDVSQNGDMSLKSFHNV